MSIGPQRPVVGSGAGTQDPRVDELLAEMPTDEVFVKNSSGQMQGTGLKLNSMHVANTFIGADENGVFKSFSVSPLAQQIIATNSEQMMKGFLGIEVPENLSDLNNDEGFFKVGDSIPVASITGLSNLAVSGSYTDLTNKPVLFDGNYASLTGKPATFTPTAHTHVIGDVSGLQSALDGKISTGSSIPYATLTGTPTIPTNTNQLTNGSGYVTTSQAATASPVQSVNGQTGAVVINIPTVNYPVSSVNSKTGAVVLNNTDVGAAATAHTHSQSDITGLTAALAAKVDTSSLSSYATTTALTAGLATKADASSVAKIRYYTATSDANSVWTVNLGTDFTTIKDVQVQAVSIANTVAGVRQASLNNYTATSTTLSGITTGNNVLSTVLISAGANTLALIPSTGVRIRVEGV